MALARSVLPINEACVTIALHANMASTSLTALNS